MSGTANGRDDPEYLEWLRKRLEGNHSKFDPSKFDPKPPAPLKPPINWLDLEGREPPPRTWWLQDWLSPSPTLVAGRGGAGKTTIVQTALTGLVTGKHFLADPARELRVLMWCCEETDEDLWRLQHSINQYFGLKMRDIQGRLHVVSRYGCDNTLMSLAFGVPAFTPMMEELREQVNDLEVDICVLDNIAQVYGANENERHQVTTFVNGLVGLVPDRPFAPVLLGHTAKEKGSEYSGSAAWENAVRMRWYIGATLPDQKIEEGEELAPGVTYLAKRKANYAPKDYRRFTFENGLFIPEGATDPGIRFDQAFRDEAAEQIVLSGMAHLKTMGIPATDGKTSPDYLPNQIVAKRIAGNHTKRELETAMNRLMAAGRLKRDIIGTYANRSTKRFGLVIP